MNTQMVSTPAARPVPLRRRIALVAAIAMPLAASVMVMVALWGLGFHWVELALLAAMYVLTVLGITVGFHRLFTHRSFETNGVIQFLLGALGSMAAEGPLLEWVAMHRIHHQHSDKPGDPHSPHEPSTGNLQFLRGLFHSHVAWLFSGKPTDLGKYVADLERNPVACFISRTFVLWVLLGMIVPALIAGLVQGTWTAALMGLLWGGLVRMGLVHHVTWSINSVCHVWGDQPYRSGDESRNNGLFGLLALGEGWHNSHHAFPTSARHGLGVWQFDISYFVIQALAWFGFASNIKLPTMNRQRQAV